MGATFTPSEVSKHSTAEDLYLIVHGKVYNVTKFQHEHPGGDEFLLDQAGTDVTELFEDTGHSEEARTILKTLQVGKMEEMAKPAAPKNPKGEPTESDFGRANSGGGTTQTALALLGVALCIIVSMVLYPKSEMRSNDGPIGGGMP